MHNIHSDIQFLYDTKGVPTGVYIPINIWEQWSKNNPNIDQIKNIDTNNNTNPLLSNNEEGLDPFDIFTDESSV